jgi:sucrose-6-phosphatase
MKLLIVIDLDNTLFKNNQGNNALNKKLGNIVETAQATATLTQKLATVRQQIYLVYVTARSYTYSRKLIAQAKLLKPDYLIASLGTEIYQQGLILEQTWANYISKEWNRDTVWAIASQFSDLKLQPKSEQTDWKLSFWLDTSASLHVLDDLQELFNFAGLPTQVMFSNGRDVHILPQCCNQGKATTYLQKLLGVHPDSTIICGGSGNNISLFKLPSMGIIVSNAQTELLGWYYKMHYPWHYLAYYPYAAGILEGLIYFNILPFPQSWRSQPISN